MRAWLCSDAHFFLSVEKSPWPCVFVWVEAFLNHVEAEREMPIYTLSQVIESQVQIAV